MTTPRRAPVKHLAVVAHNFQADRASVGRQRQVAALDVLLLVQMAGRVLVQKHGRVRVHVVGQLVDAGAERLLQRQGVCSHDKTCERLRSRHRRDVDSTRDATVGGVPCASSQIRNMMTTRLMESWRASARHPSATLLDERARRFGRRAVHLRRQQRAEGVHDAAELRR